jgi:endo-1,4-beta-D-glucanase Y
MRLPLRRRRSALAAVSAAVVLALIAAGCALRSRRAAPRPAARRSSGTAAPTATAATASTATLPATPGAPAAGTPSRGASPAPVSASAPATSGAARAAAQHFLGTYLAPDGRVVRLDQGGDTVSEGQAYAMLIAVAIGDRRAFDLAWSWAAQHLQRSDGLLSWHWQGGAVVDPQPAPDADLDAARALLLAARRFGDPSYRVQAIRIGQSVLGEETGIFGGQRLLVAGPWALSGTHYVDPSYFSPRAFEALGAATGDRRWSELAASSYAVISGFQRTRPGLPPDWATVSLTGGVEASTGPGGGGAPAYGWDAARVFVRLAEDCSASGRQLAAGGWPFLRGQMAAGSIAAVYWLTGAPAVSYSSPLADVAAAAAARAAGDQAAAAALLDRAAAQDAAAATYYGAAWVALGRIMLTTSWLGGC